MASKKAPSKKPKVPTGKPGSDSPALPKIGAPATRALARIGITTPADLRKYSAADLLELHGVGPKAIKILADAGIKLKR